MPNKAFSESRSQCILKCRDAFIKYSETKPVGGVEALRICREGCDSEPSKVRPS